MGIWRFVASLKAVAIKKLHGYELHRVIYPTKGLQSIIIATAEIKPFNAGGLDRGMAQRANPPLSPSNTPEF